MTCARTSFYIVRLPPLPPRVHIPLHAPGAQGLYGVGYSEYEYM